MLDARIPLMGVQPRPPQNPLTLMKDVMGAREEMAQLQDAARQRQELEEIRKIYQEVGIDPAKDTERIGRIAQVNPVLAEKLRVEQSKMRSGEAQAARDQAEAVGQMMETAAKWAEPIVMWMDDPKRWKEGLGMLSFLAQVAEQGGVKGAGQLVSSVSQEYSPEAYAQLRKSAQMLSQIGTLRKTPGALDKARMLLDQYRRERGEPDYDGLTRIFRDAAGQTPTSETSWSSDEMMVPDGKGGMKKINVWKNPKTRQIVDATGADVSTLAEPPPTGQTTDMAAIDEAAKNIVNNPRDLTSIRNITSLRGDQRILLYNAVKKIDPKFDLGLIDRRVQFINQYENPAGRARINRDSMNNILMHAADLSAVNKEYQRSDARLLNVPLNKLAAQYNPVYTSYMVPLTVLQNEIELYFAGGYAPHEQQKKDWAGIINGDATPAQIEQFVRSLIHVGLRRADTHNQAFRKNMGYDDPNLLTPEAVKAAEDLGMSAEVKKFGSGGILGITEQPSPAAASPSSTGARVRVRAPNGQEAWLSPADAKKAIAAGATEVK